MSRMETEGIVIHKGEKEEKYQLYVEDYVISYLKNYGAAESGTVFFYGTKQIKEKKYYIYGAGKKEEIPYFEKYELLNEIMCRMVMDMPIFSVKENTGVYELAGYHIFYQTNEAMQNYMVEQRKETRQSREEREKTRFDEKIQKRMDAYMQKKERTGSQDLGKGRNGFMTVQLAAVFVILIAIIINSTNSYTKLEELNQAAVEVFFAMENQDATKDYSEDNSNNLDVPTEGNVLRLDDLDAKFEEENQAVKADDAEEGEMGEEEIEKDKTPEEIEDAAKSEEGEDEEKQEDEKKEQNEKEAATETAPSQQAFARNFAEYYRIEKGDTLYTISIKIYGDTSKVNEICELNQISDPDNIKYGQKILLP